MTLVGLGLSAGCAPRQVPPYRDYEVLRSKDSLLTARLTEAVVEAGWALVPPSAPGVVSTAPRLFDDGLTARTEAELDLVPLDGGFVRVYVRAERRALLGGRTKVYALSPELRDSILAPLSEALAAHGLTALGAPRDRDEDEVE